MKLLLIGGTRLVGSHIVNAALARGHQLTLFNRGQEQSGQVSGVETVNGDRNGDLSKLRGRRWDAVIDTCGYLPRAVTAMAELLADAVDRYIFISSISAYASVSGPGTGEMAALATVTSEQVEAANQIDTSGAVSAFTYGSLYGGLKALCEQAAAYAMPGRVLVIRCGLVVGPHDYTDRFSYWVMRAESGGEVLAPGRPDRHVQFIDARDLAKWTVRMAETKGIGVYNASGLPNILTMAALLEACRNASASDANFTWVTDEFLLRENVAPWSQMPLWIPESNLDMGGFMSIDTRKAVAAGLRFRPVVDTARDVLKWFSAYRDGEPLKAGLDSAREEELLGAWHEAQ